MTNAYDSDANKESNLTCDEQPVTAEHEKTGEEPADASFEVPLVVDESKDAHNDTREDDAMDVTQPITTEGKRSRRPTVRLVLTEGAPVKKTFSVPKGHGKPLGQIEFINYQLAHASTDALYRLHATCFGRRGSKASTRRHLREFNGFAFARPSDEYHKHLNSLAKLKKDQLRAMSNVLGLTSTGRNYEQAERILKFLMAPTDEGKPLPAARKKKNATAARKSDATERKKGARGKAKVPREEPTDTHGTEPPPPPPTTTTTENK